MLRMILNSISLDAILALYVAGYEFKIEDGEITCAFNPHEKKERD